jgi:hypothetical protein
MLRRNTQYCTILLRSVLQLQLIASIVPSLVILSTLMMEAIYSFEMSILIRATLCNILENGILKETKCLFDACKTRSDNEKKSHLRVLYDPKYTDINV